MQTKSSDSLKRQRTYGETFDFLYLSEAIVLKLFACLQVEHCNMPSLAVSLTLNFVMKDTGYDDGRVSKLVTFVSGLLLGSNVKVRSWFASFIKTTQDVCFEFLTLQLQQMSSGRIISSQIPFLTQSSLLPLDTVLNYIHVLYIAFHSFLNSASSLLILC